MLLNAAIPRNQLTYFSIYDAQSGLTRGGSVNGRFLTDSTGQIAAWRFGLGSGGPSASSSEDSNFLPNSEVTDIRTIRLLDDPLYYHFNTNTPGVWAVAMIVPEPAGWMMILAGLPVVGCAAAYSRRRRGWECSPCV